MAQSYLQIQRQIETLQRQAEKLKSQEVAGVVERIKLAISHYALTADQLGFGSVEPVSRKKAASNGRSSAKDSSTAKYVDGKGNQWSGRGPRPHWLRDALVAGRSLDEFASNGKPTATHSSNATAPARKRTARQYRDDSGNAWSGFGPKPRWLKDALTSGATLEQYAVK